MARSFYINLLVATTLILLWCVAAWSISGSNYYSRIGEQIRQETQLTHDRAQDLADSIGRNLNYLGGVPGFFIHAVRVNKALSLFGSSDIPSKLPAEEKRKRWTADPVLNGS